MDRVGSSMDALHALHAVNSKVDKIPILNSIPGITRRQIAIATDSATSVQCLSLSKRACDHDRLRKTTPIQ